MDLNLLGTVLTALLPHRAGETEIKILARGIELAVFARTVC